jgi:hypothetical protein
VGHPGEAGHYFDKRTENFLIHWLWVIWMARICGP